MLGGLLVVGKNVGSSDGISDGISDVIALGGLLGSGLIMNGGTTDGGNESGGDLSGVGGVEEGTSLGSSLGCLLGTVDVVGRDLEYIYVYERRENKRMKKILEEKKEQDSVDFIQYIIHTNTTKIE